MRFATASVAEIQTTFAIRTPMPALSPAPAAASQASSAAPQVEPALPCAQASLGRATGTRGAAKAPPFAAEVYVQPSYIANDA
jgi:hypothetical protein